MRCPIALAPVAAAVAMLVPCGNALAGTGSQLWSQAGCGGCHTLAAAGSTGNAGPNLDQLLPSSAAVADQVASGGGGMPSFGASLSSAQIQALAAWVASVAGGGTAATSVSGPSVTVTAPALSSGVVIRLQTELKGLGYFSGPITGFYGALTTAAVAAFQKASGLTSDGVLGPQTKAALASAARTAGSTGSSATSSLPVARVQTVQRSLARLGYFAGPVTGFYGPLTTAAVKRFQQASGLTPDGIWGPRTAAALARRLSG